MRLLRRPRRAAFLQTSKGRRETIESNGPAAHPALRDAPLESAYMATSNRVLWKGAISFGLVHIPVGLHTATTEQGIDFDWLDKRSMDPVGYKRINKRTGKEIDKAHIVKGVEYENGQYVVLSPEEIEGAFPRTTQTIEIERFVNAQEIPFVYLERPYYVSPINKGHKVYALLREALARTGKIALAKVVIQTKQHLALLAPSGPALVLNLLRWGDEVKGFEGLDLPALGATAIKPSEMKMATQLIAEMTGHWKPEDFKDEFRQQVMDLVAAKVQQGDTRTVTQPAQAATGSAEIIDLTELLQRSLKPGNRRPAARPAAKEGGTAPRKTARKRAAAKAPSAQRKKAA